MAEEVFSDSGYSDDDLQGIPGVGECNAKTVRQVLDCFGQEVLQRITHNLRNGGPDGRGTISSGTLIQAGNWSVIPISSGFEFSFFFKDAPYWEAVDKGRRAGKFPPTRTLRDWVRQKIQVGRITPKKLPASESEINGIAYAIGRKIAKKGTKPTDFYSSVVTDARLAQLSRDISKASKNEALMVTKKIMKEDLVNALKGSTNVKVTKK